MSKRQIKTDALWILKSRGSRASAHVLAKDKEREAKKDARHWASVARTIKRMKMPETGTR